ncbi:hypothetical protein [Dermabacter hominis]|uniref:hypothetical protein n=1 Tax=Dermabacter hominis TaxID=36740 RepID=UPI002A44DD75|nr:hypothetical protein [Dermabacter hominis]
MVELIHVATGLTVRVADGEAESLGSEFAPVDKAEKAGEKRATRSRKTTSK